MKRLKIILKKIPYLRFVYKQIKIFFLKPQKNFIHKTAIISGKKENLFIEYNTQIWEYVIIRISDNKISIGENTQIGPFSVIFGGGGVKIGDNVMVAPHCVIASGNHNYKQTNKPMRFADNITKGPITIEDDVWIGVNCTITDGVTIGKGAVVGANSLVNKNIAPYDIVGGVPIKKISNRNNFKK